MFENRLINNGVNYSGYIANSKNAGELETSAKIFIEHDEKTDIVQKEVESFQNTFDEKDRNVALLIIKSVLRSLR